MGGCCVAPCAPLTCARVFARTLIAIINEAGFALDDRVASAEDIDLAMTLGTNYPKGPLAWAEKIGRATCRHLLDVLDEHSESGRYRAAAWFRS